MHLMYFSYIYIQDKLQVICFFLADHSKFNAQVSAEDPYREGR